MSTTTSGSAGRGGAPEFGRPSFVGGEEVTGVGFEVAGLPAEIVAALLGRGSVPEAEDQALVAVLEVLRIHRLEGLARVRGLGREGVLSQPLDPTYRRYQFGSGLVVEASDRVCRALTDAGIPSVRFKGAALVAAGLYEDLGARPMDDADVLVPTEDAHRAVDVLVEEGFEPWGPWTDGHASWLDSYTMSDPRAPAAFPVTIDLHWRTAYGSLRFGTEGAESLLWDGADLTSHLPAAGPHLLVVAEHVLKHLRVKAHLLAYADLVRLAETVNDWDAVVRVARPRFLGPAVGVLLDVLRSDLGADVPVEAIEALTAGGARVLRIRKRLRVASLLLRGPDGLGRLAGLRLRGDLAPSVRTLTRDLASSAYPDPRWLRARYGRGAMWRLRTKYTADCVKWALGRGPSPASPNQ